MVHEMRLRPTPFQKIADGSKTVELRLYDRKRQEINVGDVIVFTNLENKTERQAVKATALHRYASFADLFREIPPEECGFQSGISAEDAAKSMRDYYSDEDVRANGVLGICIERVKLSEALQDRKQNMSELFGELFPDGNEQEKSHE